METAIPAQSPTGADLPPPVVPIWDTAVASYRMVGWHLVEFFRGGWLPTLLSLATIFVGILLAALGGNLAVTVLVALAVAVAVALLAATVYVRWYRSLLVGEIPAMGVAAGRRERRMIGYGILVVLLAFAILLIPGLIALTLARADSNVPGFLVFFVGVGLTVWLTMRLIATPSLVAIDAPGNLLALSWNLMRGLAWRGFWAWILALLPVSVSSAVLHALIQAAGSETLADLVVLPFDILQGMLTVAIGALLFMCAVRLAPPAAPNAGTAIASLALLRAGVQNAPDGDGTTG